MQIKDVEIEKEIKALETKHVETLMILKGISQQG